MKFTAWIALNLFLVAMNASPIEPNVERDQSPGSEKIYHGV
jgi:hypothetical protein